MASSKFKDYKFECVYCDPKLEMHFSTTKEAMIRHCRIAHDVEEQRDAISNINELPVVNLMDAISNINQLPVMDAISNINQLPVAQIFEKLPRQERLKIEQVCKNWQHVAKNFSWANYKVFDNSEYRDWPDTRTVQTRTWLFEKPDQSQKMKNAGTSFGICPGKLIHAAAPEAPPSQVVHAGQAATTQASPSQKNTCSGPGGVFSYRRSTNIKPFFDRCGRHLRRLTLRDWSPQTALSFVKMAPNVQHMNFWRVKLDDESWKELAGIVPGLKSLAFSDSLRLHLLRREEKSTGYSLGLMECFKSMTGLEYLSISEEDALFSRHSFVQFPSNLKFLHLSYVSNTAQILSWVAEGCKNLKGLCLFCEGDENLLHALSQIKSLTYLRLSLALIPPYDVGYVFKELTELRALEIDTLDEVMLSVIARHCNKLEHLSIYTVCTEEISAEEHAVILRLISLPNMCSFEISAEEYSKEQTIELLNRLIAKGNLQFLKVRAVGKLWNDPLEPEVLLEILRRCKSIRSIALDFPEIDSDFYSKICQVVDEIDEEYRKQGEITGIPHPIVEVQYKQYLAGSIMTHKWLKFKDKISSTICEKWEFGWLSAGKPDTSGGIVQALLPNLSFGLSQNRVPGLIPPEVSLGLGRRARAICPLMYHLIKEMNRTGYVLMTPAQMHVLYGAHSPYNNSDALRRFQHVNSSNLETLMERDVHRAAALKSFKIRQRDIVLSPISFTTISLTLTVSQGIILSPVIFSALILAPAVLGPVVLSPVIFTPVILSPRALSPVILSPFAFVPFVLSPLALYPIVLSPGIFIPIILSPMVLAPFILSPVAFTPIILSPLALSPFILNPAVGSPLVLSPFVLTPILFSPQALGALVLSPYALSPVIQSKLFAYSKGLIECFKTMTGLEYLNIYEFGDLFDQYSFVQFPSNLKYLDLGCVSNASQIVYWAAEGCKDLKGLRLFCEGDDNLLHAFSKTLHVS
ncbi:moulting cycle domain-containing protein [Ditylenchus destructor]|uniref:Moulting cycle domain-containing protein n=1 Tax=Ditylenchus destructor TaxID=166010 RepID=A0AAD4R0S7_9BILA|nr:moulting cycle domain-containing protein [Ditylenchus destructor]